MVPIREQGTGKKTMAKNKTPHRSIYHDGFYCQNSGAVFGKDEVSGPNPDSGSKKTSEN